MSFKFYILQVLYFYYLVHCTLWFIKVLSSILSSTMEEFRYYCHCHYHNCHYRCQKSGTPVLLSRLQQYPEDGLGANSYFQFQLFCYNTFATTLV